MNFYKGLLGEFRNKIQIYLVERIEILKWENQP